MTRVRRPLVFCCFAIVVALSAHAGVRFRHGRADAAEAGLNLRQKVEVLFQNGVRNAQRRDDVYGQVRALEKALSAIRELAAADPGAPGTDRDVKRRIRQLKRMIAKESPSEVL